MTLRRCGVHHHWRRIETHDRDDCYGVGHNELLIREGLASRNRDKLLRSVKFGARRDRAAHESCE
jgi:aryl-alcohol dehydrogenase-like predicted oxidoreductase